MRKPDSKYFRTAARMDQAFLELLEQKEFAYISVKEICARAGVHRSTFYLHYETLADLLAESLEYMFGQFLAYFRQDESLHSRLRTCSLEELDLMTPKYLEPYLRYVQEHRRLFRAAVENAAVMRLEAVYDRLFRHVFDPILARHQVPQKDRRYMMAFYIRGLISIVEEWLRQDCADPIPRIIAIIQRCVRSRPPA